MERKTDTEICVLCRKRIKLPTDIPLPERLYYVEGCGQLCESCYNLLHSENKN